MKQRTELNYTQISDREARVPMITEAGRPQCSQNHLPPCPIEESRQLWAFPRAGLASCPVANTHCPASERLWVP